MRLLTICGSLRARSSNRAILRAYERLAPPGTVFDHYERLAALPHFNPDLDRDGQEVPAEVASLRGAIAAANAVVISTPEYAHALPGSFKNALDWLVSDPAFAEKPVVILHASRGSTWAVDSLREVLTTMSARIIGTAAASLPLGSNQVDEAAILAREDLRALLLGSIEVLMNELGRTTKMPEPKVTLTLVTEADFDELAGLRVAAMRESLERVGRFDLMRARERLRITFSPAHTRFIVFEGEKIGFYATRLEPEGLRLDHLYVHPDFQSRGIGSVILKTILADADARGLPVLVGALKESASNRFYQRHGFTATSESEWDILYVRPPATPGVT
jgi:NAD(P)H-dependent FMN reductase/GNAT superfamily N-acetyltransferase